MSVPGSVRAVQWEDSTSVQWEDSASVQWEDSASVQWEDSASVTSKVLGLIPGLFLA
jgi:hypothetical protein